MGSESVCLRNFEYGWLWITTVDTVNLLTLFGTTRRHCVSTERENKRVLLRWHWSGAEDPRGGFCLTWDVKPILALKSQTQDYLSEEEVVADLIHDFCSSHAVMLSPALRAGGAYCDTQRHIVILQTAGVGHVT